MSAYVINLTINIGEDFFYNYKISNSNNEVIDLTGYTVSSEIKKHPKSSNSINFIVSFVDREQGIIELFIPNSITNTLNSGRYVYYILLNHPNENKQITIEGMIYARGGISLFT